MVEASNSAIDENVIPFKLEEIKYSNELNRYATYDFIQDFETHDPLYQISISYYLDKISLESTCKITIRGKIKTEDGELSVDLEIEITLEGDQDCVDATIRILRGLRD